MENTFPDPKKMQCTCPTKSLSSINNSFGKPLPGISNDSDIDGSYEKNGANIFV